MLVTSRDAVVAEIKAPAPRGRPLRRRGGLKGRIWLSEDSETLPEDVIAAMEASNF